MAKMYGKNSGYLKKKDLKHYALSGIIPIILLIAIWIVLKNHKQLGDWNFVFIVFLLVIIAKALEPVIRSHKKRSNQYYPIWLDLNTALDLPNLYPEEARQKISQLALLT